MLWVVIISFILSFILAVGLGANDVSNAFATSIGAKVLTLKRAFLIASIAELVGSISLGGLVTENIQKYTIKSGILSSSQMLIGMMTCLLSVGSWLIIATWMKLPVSTTHAVFSSIVGFCLVADPDAIYWRKMFEMMIAWVVAPLIAGIFSVIVFILLTWFILRKRDSYVAGLRAIPLIYTLTMTVNLALILYQVLYRTYSATGDEESDWTIPICIGVGVTLAIALGTFFTTLLWIVPWMKQRVNKKILQDGTSIELVEMTEVSPSSLELKQAAELSMKDPTIPCISPTEQLFAFLQILSAVFTSFAHGSNDVSNSVGPLVSMYNAYLSSQSLPTVTGSSPIIYGFLGYGAIGIIIGLYGWGARVIETIGSNLTSMCPSRGFAIELGSALAVLIASITGFSVSTTHCKVGSIVAVGFFSHYITTWLCSSESESLIEKNEKLVENPLIETEDLTLIHNKQQPQKKIPLVNWKLCLNIVLSWIFTIPFSGLLAAGFYALFSLTINNSSFN